MATSSANPVDSIRPPHLPQCSATSARKDTLVGSVKSVLTVTMATHLCQVVRASCVSATTTRTPRLRATVTESLGDVTAVSMTQRASVVSGASQVSMAMLWREIVQRVSATKLDRIQHLVKAVTMLRVSALANPMLRESSVTDVLKAIGTWPAERAARSATAVQMEPLRAAVISLTGNAGARQGLVGRAAVSVNTDIGEKHQTSANPVTATPLVQ